MTIAAILHALTRRSECQCACYRNGYLAARVDTLRVIFPRMAEHRLRRLALPIRRDA